MATATPVSGSQLALPVLILNMGGEMLYILEQRLQAQNITEEKSLRVLQDVISTMFSDKFVTELFKPQRIYSNTSTRQIFDRLAHSSIMRLNESSMEKLYDLMTMGCKHQVMSSAHPTDLIQITLNHLDALRALVKTPEAIRLVEGCTKQFLDTFSSLPTGEFAILRQTLARFFQDRRVKVSLFLQDQLQSADGSMLMSQRGALPRGAETPGTIRYFGDDGAVSREEKVALPNAAGVTPSADPSVDITKPGRPCTLGTNIYSRDRKKAKVKPTPPATPLPKPTYEPTEVRRKAAKAELNMLAQMIGSTGAAPTSPAPADRLNIGNLFPEANAAEGKEAERRAVQVIAFDSEEAEEWSKLLTEQIGTLDLASRDTDGADDLLSLMDGA